MQIIYFLFPLIRDLLLKTGLIWHGKDRQPYAVGFLKEGISTEKFQHRLMSLGFEKNIIAWVDFQEAVSLRLIDKKNLDCHFHVRLFEDGEIRGHYEKTAESHPIDHILERGMKEASKQIQTIIGEEFIETASVPEFVSGNTISQSAPAMLRGVPIRG